MDNFRQSHHAYVTYQNVDKLKVAFARFKKHIQIFFVINDKFNASQRKSAISRVNAVGRSLLLTKQDKGGRNRQMPLAALYIHIITINLAFHCI